MNGWPVDTNSDKYLIRSESLLACNLDLIGIAETHLRDDKSPMLDGYTAFTHNRTHLHRRARSGSGGVCLFIKSQLLQMYSATILDITAEDVLWVQLKHNSTSYCVNVCVCYLPPDGSSRHIDPSDFFNRLLSHIYLYQSSAPCIVCGDFNARCGNESDFINGVDCR